MCQPDRTPSTVKPADRFLCSRPAERLSGDIKHPAVCRHPLSEAAHRSSQHPAGANRIAVGGVSGERSHEGRSDWDGAQYRGQPNHAGIFRQAGQRRRAVEDKQLNITRHAQSLRRRARLRPADSNVRICRARRAVRVLHRAGRRSGRRGRSRSSARGSSASTASANGNSTPTPICRLISKRSSSGVSVATGLRRNACAVRTSRVAPVGGSPHASCSICSSESEPGPGSSGLSAMAQVCTRRRIRPQVNILISRRERGWLGDLADERLVGLRPPGHLFESWKW
jgi:hypothetical protein